MGLVYITSKEHEILKLVMVAQFYEYTKNYHTLKKKKKNKPPGENNLTSHPVLFLYRVQPSKNIFLEQKWVEKFWW